jgi:hypothetical protein
VDRFVVKQEKVQTAVQIIVNRYILNDAAGLHRPNNSIFSIDCRRFAFRTDNGPDPLFIRRRIGRAGFNIKSKTVQALYDKMITWFDSISSGFTKKGNRRQRLSRLDSPHLAQGLQPGNSHDQTDCAQRKAHEDTFHTCFLY